MRIKTTFLTFFALLLAISTDGLLRADIVAHFPLDEDSIDTGHGNHSCKNRNKISTQLGTGMSTERESERARRNKPNRISHC